MIAAIKLTRSAWVCAVERAAASASGGLLITALQLLVVAGILFLFLREKTVDGRTVGRLAEGQTDGRKTVDGRTDGRLPDEQTDG